MLCQLFSKLLVPAVLLPPLDDAVPEMPVIPSLLVPPLLTSPPIDSPVPAPPPVATFVPNSLEPQPLSHTKHPNQLVIRHTRMVTSDSRPYQCETHARRVQAMTAFMKTNVSYGNWYNMPSSCNQDPMGHRSISSMQYWTSLCVGLQ